MSSLPTLPLSSFVRDYRPVVDGLADGEVLLSQRGGELLLLTTLQRREGDRHAVAALAHLLRHVLDEGNLAAVLAHGLTDAYPWVEFLPEHERTTFLDEFLRVLRACAALGRFTAFEQMVAAWRSTAEIYADPALLARLRQVGTEAAVPAPAPMDGDEVLAGSP